jgi:hypothetical protein
MTHTTAVYFDNGGSDIVIQPTGSVTLTGAVASVGSLTAGTSLLVNTTSVLTGNVTIGASKVVITAATGLVTIDGGATNPGLKLTGAGNVSGTTAGTAYTSGAPSLCAAQLSMRVYIGTTPYRIPLWADA